MRGADKQRVETARPYELVDHVGVSGGQGDVLETDTRRLQESGGFPKQTLRLLRRYSDKINGNGRIVHEVTTAGAVSNPGNTQETAQFIMTVGKLLDWSGDTAFAREMYPAMKQGLGWLLGDMDRGFVLRTGRFAVVGSGRELAAHEDLFGTYIGGTP